MANRHRAARAPRRTSAAQRVQARARDLARMRSVGDLQRHYAGLCTTTLYRELRDAAHLDEVLSLRQIADAAFGLRHLEIVSGRHLDVRAHRLSRWMLAVAG
jgi:hypothetical protein